jgi:hypothetical protein
MTSSSLLRSARKLISDERNWISGKGWKEDTRMAEDSRGREIDPRHEAARRFTLDGALLRCADLGTKDGQGDYHQVVQHLRSMAKGKTLAEINDLKSHKTILEMMERAAAALNVEQRIAA